MTVVLLFAFALRVWQLQEMPPGWRDDELINSLVISQKALDGDWAVYYADASGHEALYHVLNAGMLGLFGANALGIRLLSVFLGLLTVALTYQVGRQLVSREAGILAAAMLAASFWSLMYSRIGLRHVLTPPLMLAAVYFFWQATKPTINRKQKTDNNQRPLIHNSQFTIHNSQFSFFLSALFVSLGLYTYFASRGVPLIFLVVVGYTAVFFLPRFKQQLWGILLFFGVTAVLSLPLIITLQQQPESEARVAELAVPLIAMQEGDYEPLREYVVTTLSMFHAAGDNEWLYNIPNRPVLRGELSLLFWLGILFVVWWAVQPLLSLVRRREMETAVQHRALAGGLLFAWWLAGISPGFISVPPASLGHTILAQPATFIILVIPIALLIQLKNVRQYRGLLTILWLAGLVLSLGGRDWPAYFRDWPERGMVRFLYRADIRDVADYVNNSDLADFGVTGLLAGPWDKVALDIDLETEARPRWYNPQRALLLSPSVSFSGYPDVPTPFGEQFMPLGTQVGGYALTETKFELISDFEPVCFENGLCAVYAEFDQETLRLTLGWRVERPLTLPPNPLISNPPPPGVYAGPRLLVFAQLLDAEGNFLVGDDGLWVDPYTLHEGDLFIQQHWLQPPDGRVVETAVFGLYDPMTGQRVLTTEDSVDNLRFTIYDLR